MSDQDKLALAGLGIASYILWSNKTLIALLALGYLAYKDQSK